MTEHNEENNEAVTLHKMLHNAKDRQRDILPEVTTTYGRCFNHQKYRPALKACIPVRLFQTNKQGHPVDNVGLLSTITFSWITSLIWKSFNKPPRIEDLWKLSKYDEAEWNFERMSSLWQQELKLKGIKKASLWKVVLRFVRTRLVISCFFVFIMSLTMFSGSAIIIRNLLFYVSDKNSTLNLGVILIVSLFCLEATRACMLSLVFVINYRSAIRTRAALLLLIFKRVLRMSPSKTGTTVGELVTMCSNDGDRTFESNRTGNLVVLGPVVFLCGIIYTCYLLGPIGLVGSLIFIIVLPIQGLLVKYTNNFREKAVVFIEEREIKTNEILSSIKLIKMYAWEKSFFKIVEDIRNKELKVLTSINFLQSLNISLAFITPLIASVVMISSYVLLGNMLTAEEAFTSIAVFNTMANALKFLPISFKSIAEVNVTFKRLKKFLILDCLEKYVTNNMSSNGNAIEIKKASFSWGSSLHVPDDIELERDTNHQDKPEKKMPLNDSGSECKAKAIILENVSFCIPKGSLVGIYGSVGSGKSSLLSSIMGELKLLDGAVAVSGSVAYAAQQAWLMNATIRENVIFGSGFDRKKYNDIISACELTADFEIFPSGDLAEVGERGVNLSGGQKQRISLARALYSDQDIYLLDDPLSAVDTHVGRNIFFEVILTRLKNKGKTVIFVTHQLQYLPHCDQVFQVKDSSIHKVDDFTYTKLTSSSSGSLKLFTAEENVNKPVNLQSKCSASSIVKSDCGQEEDLLVKGKLMTKEESGKGIPLSTYFAYLKASGGVFAGLLMALFFILNVSIQQFSYFWLSFWLNAGSGDTQVKNSTTNMSSLSESVSFRNVLLNPNLNFYLSIYVSSIAVMFVLSALRGYAFICMAMRAAHVFHQSLFKTVLNGTMAFFDTTPTGRILNRFQKDIDEQETILPALIEFFFFNFTTLIFACCLVVYVFPKFLFALLVIFPIFLTVYILFKPAARELKRLDVLTRSPWFAHISATVSGLDTIRAYKKSEEFIETFCKLLNTNSIPCYLFACVNRWLAIRLDMLTISSCVITSVFVVMDKSLISPAFIGLALSSVFILSGLLRFTIRLLTEAEARFVCTDRIKYYIDNTEQENSDPSIILIEHTWPEKGEIEFENMSMRYREGLPLALEKLSFKVKCHEKVGVVGRTGSGKSSLAVSLFRLTELSSGSIFIDGVDISKLSLYDLRSRLSIIPQDPVLFSGSVRYNLDPFSRYSDSAIWLALEQAHMKDSILRLSNQLESVVSENGSNFSVGERQLLCLARALLRNSKVLVLDEATAAVDHETEAIVQEVIESEFSACTVLMIAHRLSSVTSCDRILVLDKGQIVEFDSPAMLLQNKDSAFSKMMLSYNSDVSISG